MGFYRNFFPASRKKVLKLKAGTSKQKGNVFENLIAKKLSSWLTSGKRIDCLVRSQNSGGRTTMLSYSGIDFASQVGDICAATKEGLKLTDKFLLETKHYKTLNLQALFYGTPKDGILQHWSKLLKDSEKYKKFPMYIVRENSKPILISLNSKGKEFFKLNDFFLISSFPKLDIYIYKFEDFLKNVKF